VSKAGSDGKTSSSGASKSKKQAAGGEPARFKAPFGDSYDAGRAAAEKLAAAAGISGLRTSSGAAAAKKSSYKTIDKSPFNKKQLDEFREMLLAKRRELLGDMTSMESEALSRSESSHTPNHLADQGSDTYDQALNLNLVAGQRTLIREIDAALERIRDNTYGICDLLQKPIKAERLKHTPWARFSIEAARMIEDDPSILRELDRPRRDPPRGSTS